MKSALAGMYPAMSRDNTESKVGLGGSSEAGMSINWILHNMEFVVQLFVLAAAGISY